MLGRSYLDDEQKTRITELRVKYRLSYKDIGIRMGKSKDTIKSVFSASRRKEKCQKSKSHT